MEQTRRKAVEKVENGSGGNQHKSHLIALPAPPPGLKSMESGDACQRTRKQVAACDGIGNIIANGVNDFHCGFVV